MTTPKYTVDNLLPALRLAVRHRREMLAYVPDNGGAILPLEKIADRLSVLVRYPEYRRATDIKRDPNAEMTAAAQRRILRGEHSRVRVEHVNPRRAWAVTLAAQIDAGVSDAELLKFIKTEYWLVVLTNSEARDLDAINRTNIETDRLEAAGLVMKNK
jgi:hypothetical protein